MGLLTLLEEMEQGSCLLGVPQALPALKTQKAAREGPEDTLLL